MDRKPCFGDRVINTFAGAANPHREGVFVRSINRLGKLNHGEWYQCTNGKGDFWEIDPRSLEIVSRASADEERIRREERERCAVHFEEKAVKCHSIAGQVYICIANEPRALSDPRPDAKCESRGNESHKEANQ